MARPKSADPDVTRERIFRAAREIAISEGMGNLSARPVAKAAGVSATTVCALFNGMSGLRRKLVQSAFDPLIDAFADIGQADVRSAFDIATAPLRAERFLPVLVTQVAAFAGLQGEEHRALAGDIATLCSSIRDYFATYEISAGSLPSTDDRHVIADRIIAIYFAAAFHLARDPDINPAHLRKTLAG